MDGQGQQMEAHHAAHGPGAQAMDLVSEPCPAVACKIIERPFHEQVVCSEEPCHPLEAHHQEDQHHGPAAKGIMPPALGRPGRGLASEDRSAPP